MGRPRQRRLSLRHLVRQGEALEVRHTLDSTVVLNEVMYHPANDAPLEFIELYNQMGTDMDISKWRLGQAVDYTFAEGTVLPTGGFLLIAEDPIAFQAATGKTALGPYVGKLSNDGERIELRDRNERLMDVMNYADASPWTSEPDGMGPSLSKRERLTRSDVAEHWTSSLVVGGTPGAANFGDQSSPIDAASLLPENVPVVINEISSGDAQGNEFFVEFYNRSTKSVDLSQFQVDFGDNSIYKIPANTQLSPSSYLTIPPLNQTIAHQVGTRIALRNPAGSVVWSSAILDTLGRSRSPDGVGELLVSDHPTAGHSNAVSLNEDIVINEVMYHHAAQSPYSPTDATFDRTTVVPLNGTWRYNESGEALPTTWYTAPHALGGNWKTGTGLIGFETSAVVAPGIGTTIADPTVSAVTTFYFETEFTVTADQLATISRFDLRHIIDDGAAFYLNGREITRFNLSPGDLTSATLASVSVNNAVVSDAVSFSKDLLVAGVNRFAVEVHQRTATSNDVLFGAELVLSKEVSPAIPGKPFEANDEEWIELYNRGTQTVDLSNWKLSDAVTYTFPAGTTLAPQAYLVVARDADQMRVTYPEIASQIVGNYQGQLGNTEDHIRLLDRVGNPADDVHYFENGQWPDAADGDGSSLELRDPWADNSQGLAWGASDESTRSSWQTFTYRGVTKASTVGPDGQWQELVLGLLDDGVMLLDDIRVIQDPAGTPVSLIQNGTFEGDTIGSTPAKWRAIGNHRHSPVVVDPDNPNNKAWKFVATGPTEHMHNHAETTFRANDKVVPIQNGMEYEISFRAKWISGSNLINSRLYFNRLPHTSHVEMPTKNGTPGQPNSQRVANLGPVYREMHHSPVIPNANQPVTVSIDVIDRQQVASAILWYSVQGGEWKQVPMANVEGVHYAAQIPGQAAASVVQFYVEATDGAGAATTFPRDGRDSRALYKVQDGMAGKTGLHNLRMIFTPADATFMHTDVELMSNDPLGATIVYNESQVFYDAHAMTSGSQRARPFDVRLGFSVSFNSDDLFRDVHSSLTLDRSESTFYGQREIIYDHAGNHAGGVPSKYNDLFHIITPKATHTGPAQIEMARYSDVFLDEQYANGSDGQVYEYELIYFPTSASGGAEGRKRPQPDDVRGVAIRYMTDNKDDYRFVYINKNNRLEDDYSRLIEFTKFMGLSNAEFLAQADQYIDVEQWLRAFANGVLSGHGDNFLSDGSQHNLQIYVRPDGIVELFPHDLDAFFDATRPVVGNEELRRLMRDPNNAHTYYGIVDDMIQTTYNANYMKRWTDHWGALIPTQPFAQHLTELVRRSTNLTGQIVRAAPRVDFAITNAPATVDSPTATLTGNGWVNVRTIRLAGSPTPLNINWTATTAWQAEVPLVQGVNTLALEAFDFQGNRIGTAQAVITSTAINDVAASLRLSELHYHPANPSSAEQAQLGNVSDDDFEFIEFTNISNKPINLLGTQLRGGLEFTFSSLILGAGEVGVVVSNEAAFRARYGATARILGSFTRGNLSNAGELITLADATGKALLNLQYTDVAPWPTSADGEGFSLTLRDVTDTTRTAAQLAQPTSWSASMRSGGSAGRLNRETDYNADERSSVADINALCRAVRSGDLAGDLNADGHTTLSDFQHFITEVWRTHPGDANLDGVFNSDDLTLVFQLGQYEDTISNNSSWQSGDFDCDLEFTTSDIVLAFQSGAYELAPPAAVAANDDRTANVAAALATTPSNMSSFAPAGRHDGASEANSSAVGTIQVPTSARDGVGLTDAIFDEWPEDATAIAFEEANAEESD